LFEPNLSWGRASAVSKRIDSDETCPRRATPSPLLIRYRLHVLYRDPYDEGAHLALVSDLVGAGHHGEARRAYRRYVTRMDEIDVEPAPFPGADTALTPL
jgi:hypothetical protein